MFMEIGMVKFQLYTGGLMTIVNRVKKKTLFHRQYHWTIMKKNINPRNINFFKGPLYLYWAFLFPLFAISNSYSQLDSLKYKFDSKPTIGLKMETKNFVIQNYWSSIQEIKPLMTEFFQISYE